MRRSKRAVNKEQQRVLSSKVDKAIEFANDYGLPGAIALALSISPNMTIRQAESMLKMDTSNRITRCMLVNNMVEDWSYTKRGERGRNKTIKRGKLIDGKIKWLNG